MTSFRLDRLPRGLPGLVAGAFVVSIAAAGPVYAEPKDDEVPSRSAVEEARDEVEQAKLDVGQVRARLARADQRLRQANAELETAVEAYNTAMDKLHRAERTATETRYQADQAQEAVVRERRAIGRWAAANFQRQTPLRELNAYLTADGPRTLLDQAGLSAMAESSLARDMAKLRAAEAVAKSLEKQARSAVSDREAAALRAQDAERAAEKAVRKQRHEVEEITAEKEALVSRLAELEQISVRLAERRQEGLAARARERADEARTDGGGSETGEKGPEREGTSESTTRAGRIAVEFAMAQLGEPYVFGAAGPTTWDCSGLTKRAWEEAGIVMPHYARGQYWQSLQIGVSDIRPGDLLYWANDPADSNTIHHVAMYIGDGEMIHAPRPGRSVEIQSMWYMGTPTHYARPR